MIKLLKRYSIVLVMILINFVLLIVTPDIGKSALLSTFGSLKQMALIMPPIFILIGILDVWIEKETMMKFMGKESGLPGIALAFLLGSVAAGPLYVAFPFAGVLLKKGCRFLNVLIFLGAWAATKIPISLFEASVMGWRFMLTRYGLDVGAILLIAWITDKLMPEKEKEKIYQDAQRPIG